jgi:hypothetical protein
MGRPPIGKHALSGAERQRRYMAKLLAGKPSVTKPAQADTAEIDKLKTHIAELERKLTLARMASGKMPESVAEMDAMRRIADEVRAAGRARAKAARLAKAPPVDAGETLETLAEKLRQREQQLKGAQTRIRNLKEWTTTLRGRKTIPISKELLRTIRAKMHPDSVTDPKEQKRLTKLSQEFNSFKFVTPEE